LNKCSSGSKNIKKLFWKGIPAHGPKTAAYAAGHDHTVIIAHQKLVLKTKPKWFGVKFSAKQLKVYQNQPAGTRSCVKSAKSFL
jgi:hypothetical protein